MREGDFVFLWAFCRMRKEKKQMHILCWLGAGALIIFFCSEKVVGALIGVGAFKGMNTVNEWDDMTLLFTRLYTGNSKIYQNFYCRY